jgi:hypothetical protein
MRLIFAATVLLLAGCASTGQYAAVPATAKVATPTDNTAAAEQAWRYVEREWTPCRDGEPAFDCDRRAILAMTGEFKVDFRFDETVVLSPGYERRPEHRSGGFEAVVLIEDAGERIDLQHILVMGGHVVKHWRQTWVYQANPIWRFEGGQRFRQYQRDAATLPGSWTQFVHEVSDAPRYAGSGKWNHRYGVSTWTSDRTWRPLPRREYTKRDDYHLLNVENRHTITPQGWTHEQDNTKVVRGVDGADRSLVREFGFNDYRRISGYDFTPGYTYWKETGPFWRTVRQRWETSLARTEGITLDYPTDDEAFIAAIFAAADGFRESRDLTAADASVAELFAKSVHRGEGQGKALADRAAVSP